MRGDIREGSQRVIGVTRGNDASDNDTPGARLIRLDPDLALYSQQIDERHKHYGRVLRTIAPEGDLLGVISQGHHYLGLHRGWNNDDPGMWYREWAPQARSLSLIGEFNGWDRGRNPLTYCDQGIWCVFLPDHLYGPHFVHGSRYKVHVETVSGSADRIPAYATRVVQDTQNLDYAAQYWHPKQPFTWEHAIPKRRNALRIYEAHIGMAQEEYAIGSYSQFADRILPRIAELGYNAVQLMAIAEHPYYASFGYHVSSFFAASSRFGTPEELKHLIDKAHGYGLLVIMDLVHSHAVKNVNEGLNNFYGSGAQYFHSGSKGYHPAWDSLCFNYGSHDVLCFLLSNIRFWLEEYHFDGFRFDGVTSMLYLDHGLHREFSRYDDYFDGNVDHDAVTYLMLANDLIHRLRPEATTIAEDVSGMPGLARSINEGGLGFDYRLAMGIPDYWQRLLTNEKDEQWSLSALYQNLLHRRSDEKHISYVESHDQSIVGGKTMAFHLMGESMYWHMSKLLTDLQVSRGVALHKMIRLMTFALGGEGYMNFMGNEFGHPEWIDFPREGNGFCYRYARRQWSAVDDKLLYYADLNRFDQALQSLEIQYPFLETPSQELLTLHEEDRYIAFSHGSLVFVFNFHPDMSYNGLRIPVPEVLHYKILLDTDQQRFGGQGSVQSEVLYLGQDVSAGKHGQSIQIYVPARSAQVLVPLSMG
jgi:1,4-alpha-glucan branching enzyme